eukprot:130249-Amorphochlora_amoeboformis.AAC.3
MENEEMRHTMPVMDDRPQESKHEPDSGYQRIWPIQKLNSTLPTYLMNGGMGRTSWGGEGEDPEDTLRNFSKKFRDKEDEYKTTIEELSNSNDDLEITRSRCLLKIDQLQGELKNMESKLETNTKALKGSKACNEDRLAKIGQLKKMHQDYLKMREAQAIHMASRHEKERAHRRAHIAKLNEDINNRGERIAQLEDELKVLKGSQNELTVENKRLKTKIKDSIELMERVQKLEEADLKTRVVMERMRTTNESLSQNLENQIRDKLKLGDELESTRALLNMSKRETKDAVENSETLAEQNAKFAKKSTRDEEEMSKLKAKIRELRERMMAFEDELGDAKEEIEQHHIASKQAKQQYDELQDSITKAKGMNAHLRGELENIGIEHKTLKQTIRKLTTEINHLQAEKGLLKNKLQLATDIDNLDLEKLSDIMLSSRRMAGALENIQSHVQSTRRAKLDLEETTKDMNA